MKNIISINKLKIFLNKVNFYSSLGTLKSINFKMVEMVYFNFF